MDVICTLHAHWYCRYLGSMYTVDELGASLDLHGEALEGKVLSNPWELLITCMGTSSQLATRSRSLGGCALCRGKDIFIFDAGGCVHARVWWDAGVGYEVFGAQHAMCG